MEAGTAEEEGPLLLLYALPLLGKAVVLGVVVLRCPGVRSRALGSGGMYREPPSLAPSTCIIDGSGRPLWVGAVEGGVYRGGSVGFSRLALGASPPPVRSEDVLTPRGIVEAKPS